VNEILDAAALMQLFREVTAELELDLSEAKPDTPLKSLGLDSLDQFELLTALEDKVGLRISDDKVSGIGTISDVINCFLDMQQEAHQPSNHEAGSDR
jgi:acyl carrier protein